MTKTAESFPAQRAGQLLKGWTGNAHKPITSEPKARNAGDGTVDAFRESCVKA